MNADLGQSALAKAAFVVQAVEFTSLMIGLVAALAVPRDGSIQLIPFVVNSSLAIAVPVACLGCAGRSKNHQQGQRDSKQPDTH